MAGYEDVDGRRVEVRVHRWPGLAAQDLPDLVLRRLGGRVAWSSARAHAGQRPSDGVPDDEEEEREYEQDHQPEDTDVEEQLVHPRQFAEGSEEAYRTPAGQSDKVSDHAVDDVRHQQRQEQVGGYLSGELVEVAARDPAGDGHQRVDHL